MRDGEKGRRYTAHRKIAEAANGKVLDDYIFAIINDTNQPLNSVYILVKGSSYPVCGEEGSEIGGKEGKGGGIGGKGEGGRKKKTNCFWKSCLGAWSIQRGGSDLPFRRNGEL